MLKCLNVCHVKNEDQHLLFGIGIYFLYFRICLRAEINRKENLEISHNYSLSATALDVSFLKTKYDYPPRSL